MTEAEELAGAINRLDTELVLLVGRIEAAGHTAQAGAAGTRQWLERRCGMTPQDARAVVQTARFLNEHPHTADAVANNQVSLTKVETLARRVRGRRDALYADHEGTLIDLATRLDLGEFTKAVRHWAVLADDVLTNNEHMQRHRTRRLHVSTTINGVVMGDFALESIDGRHLIRALDALSPPDPNNTPGGPRTLAQRRADALVELANRYLTQPTRNNEANAGADDESHTGELSRTLGRFNPNLAVNVMIDLDTLTGNSPLDWAKVRCEIDGIGPVGRHTIERIVCNHHLRRVIVDPPSNIINQGRATRFATPTQRAALIARDGGCIGCGRPADWCDVHHTKGWAITGDTDLADLVLVCRICHTLVHEGQWQVIILDNGHYHLEPPNHDRGPPVARSP